MDKNNSKRTVEKLFALAGIKINGKNSWDMKVHNENFYTRVLTGGSLALGESYMDGWWDCEKLDEFFFRILQAELNKKVKQNSRLFLQILSLNLFNFQKKSRALKIGKTHYDIGNELYENMLDKRLVYTCGYWKNAKDLDSAQEEKLDLVCKKIGLKKGMKVLDIGCGWGSFAKFAAEKYGVKVIGITISKEQVKLGKELCKGFSVEIRLQDYRNLNEKFDRIVSLGMFEHVGVKNYRKYFEMINNCLKNNGLFLLHTIGSNVSKKHADPWIDKYIFPRGVIPSIKQIGKSTEGLFVMEDWHNLGADYDKTLMVWYNDFDKNWNKIKLDYNEEFYRMWKYYLLSSAGSFRARKNQLWQIVLSKEGTVGGYQSIR